MRVHCELNYLGLCWCTPFDTLLIRIPLSIFHKGEALLDKNIFLRAWAAIAGDLQSLTVTTTIAKTEI